MNKTSIERVESLISYYIYLTEFAPDWGNLQVALYDEGLTSSEVYNIMSHVRKEGTAP